MLILSVGTSDICDIILSIIEQFFITPKQISVAWAGLDVFYQEPVSADNPLLSLNNVSVAPHVAWLTNETFSRSIEIAVKNSLAVGGDGKLLHRVI